MRRTIVCLCFLGIFGQTIAQDPSFSQFYANRIYLNPAFAGLESGMAFSAATRAQWMAADRGFRTYTATLEMQVPVVQLGWGLHVMRNEEGLAGLNTNQAGFALSYTIPGKYNNVHFGFEGRLVQKQIDWSKLVFSDQLDPVFGQIYPGSLSPVLDRVTFGDADFGIVWRHESKKRGRTVRSHLGLSMHHLPYLFQRSSRGNDSFLNLENSIAPRTTLHGGWMIPVQFFQGVGHEIALLPHFKLDMQGYKFLNPSENITVATAGLYGMVNNLYVGLFYQNKWLAPQAVHTDAFIFTLGAYFSPDDSSPNNQSPTVFLGLSADINATGVGPAAGSVFEATIRYRFAPNVGGGLNANGQRSRSKKRILDCKNFF